MHDGALLAPRAPPALQENAGLVGGTIIRLHDAQRGYADAPSDGLSSKFCALAPRGSALWTKAVFPFQQPLFTTASAPPRRRSSSMCGAGRPSTMTNG